MGGPIGPPLPSSPTRTGNDSVKLKTSSKRRSQTKGSSMKRDSNEVKRRPGTPPKRHQSQAKGSVGASNQAPGLWCCGKGFVRVKLGQEKLLYEFPVTFEWQKGENALLVQPEGSDEEISRAFTGLSCCCASIVYLNYAYQI